MDLPPHLEFLGELIVSAAVLAFAHYTNIIPLTSFLGVESPNYLLPPLSVLIGYFIWLHYTPHARPENPTEYIIVARVFIINVTLLAWGVFLFPFLFIIFVSALGFALPVLWGLAIFRYFRSNDEPERDEFGWRYDVDTTRLREPYFMNEFNEDNMRDMFNFVV